MGLAIGIDLGTTNSVAAVARPTGVEIALGPRGERVQPSVVAFTSSGAIMVGQDARQRRAVDPRNTIYSAKRLIGQNYRAPMVQLALTAMPFLVEEGDNQQPIIVVRGRRLTVPEVSSLVLGHLKTLTQKQMGEEATQAVVTVPANFSDAQRQATREAGLLAGLEVLRLVNEPTAAALAYGYGKNLEAVVAVFDFGGGTFDVSILHIADEIFEVLGTGGDFFLGGDDIDRTLAEYLAAELNRQSGVDARRHPEAMTRLVMAAEEIKCHLSKVDVAEGTISGLLVADRSTPLSLPFRVTRNELENMITGYVERTMDVCRQVLLTARIQTTGIQEVICVGGTTRIPLVRRRVAELFNREPSMRINPDEVVAYGAAIQAGILSGGVNLLDQNALLLDVTPATLGIATAGGYTERLLEKNAPIPIERSKIFTTAHDYQTRVVIDCCRGESKRFGENEVLGSLSLEHLPPGPRGDAQIEVTFRVDADGILHVRARDKKTGQKREATLNVIGAPVHHDAPIPSPAAPVPVETGP